MKMQIVAYDRGPLKVSDTIKREEINFENVEVKISMLLKCNPKGGFLGSQFTVSFIMGEGIDIAELGMMFTVYIEGWPEFIQKNPSNEEIFTFLKADGKFFEFMLNAANAVVMERGVGTLVEGFFVPCIVDIDEFIQGAVRILITED